MLICVEKGWKNNLIVTDSKSVINKIRKIVISPANRELIFKIKNTVEEEKKRYKIWLCMDTGAW